MTTNFSPADQRLHIPAGATSNPPWALSVEPEDAGWEFSGLRVVELQPGDEVSFYTEESEALVLPLSGSCEVSCDGELFELRGRRSVFVEISDFVYLPREAEVSLSSHDGGKFALPSARCERRLSARYGPAKNVSVELRGTGNCSRQVNNLCTPEVFEADRLIACEVLTPAGNWSSHPPHKHDTEHEGECVLEEIYYYEVSGGTPGDGRFGGIAYQRVYGEPHRPVNVLAEVRSGDVVLVPHGWHGPSMAVPGYDLYYLNVMAGPGPERAWRVSDDPSHAWIRETWHQEQIDPRLPMSGA